MSDARERLLDAAKRHVESGDIGAVSSRALAAEVGVSHTLVNYHFGSRAALVEAAVDAIVAPRAALHNVIAHARANDGSIDLDRLAQGIVAVWEHPQHGPRVANFVRRTILGDPSSQAIGEYLQQSAFEPVAADVGRTHARRIAIAMVGFVFGRYLLRLPMFAHLTVDEAVRLLRSMMR